MATRTPEHERAYIWRRKHGLTRQRLAELTGYSREAIVWFEKGSTPVGGQHGAPAWKRYKRACQAVDLELKHSFTFNW